jgi:hypothetical protein
VVMVMMLTTLRSRAGRRIFGRLRSGSFLRCCGKLVSTSPAEPVRILMLAAAGRATFHCIRLFLLHKQVVHSLICICLESSMLHSMHGSRDCFRTGLGPTKLMRERLEKFVDGRKNGLRSQPLCFARSLRNGPRRILFFVHSTPQNRHSTLSQRLENAIFASASVGTPLHSAGR